METTKSPKWQKIILIAALIIGIFLIYREYQFWRNYREIKQFIGVGANEIKNFKEKFKERLDHFNEKEKEFDTKFSQKTKAFSKRWQGMFVNDEQRRFDVEEMTRHRYENELKESLNIRINAIFTALKDENTKNKLDPEFKKNLEEMQQIVKLMKEAEIWYENVE